MNNSSEEKEDRVLILRIVMMTNIANLKYASVNNLELSKEVMKLRLRMKLSKKKLRKTNQEDLDVLEELSEELMKTRMVTLRKNLRETEEDLDVLEELTE